MRPEAISIGDRGATPSANEATSLDGEVGEVTYLGHAIDYVVKIGWIDLEVRGDATAGTKRFNAGDEVSVWWDQESDWVVAN